ncbi:hypothetical protein UY3_18937 [Chelonia mydas]|uniref:Uncharacterized protein n=1 Tax=Chelonia mydas TaxID=8469 RepID=M7AW47_CHEMY|nr:hypothetical protein UY3_18937 [Chelonia mydas]
MLERGEMYAAEYRSAGTWVEGRGWVPVLELGPCPLLLLFLPGSQKLEPGHDASEQTQLCIKNKSQKEAFKPDGKQGPRFSPGKKRQLPPQSLAFEVPMSWVNASFSGGNLLTCKDSLAAPTVGLTCDNMVQNAGTGRGWLITKAALPLLELTPPHLLLGVDYIPPDRIGPVNTGSPLVSGVIVGVLTQKGVVGQEGSHGYCRGGCGTATLTSALLLAAALPSELGSWRAAAAGRGPSSEGRAAEQCRTKGGMV